jgi:hypothetical protein
MAPAASTDDAASEGPASIPQVTASAARRVTKPLVQPPCLCCRPSMPVPPHLTTSTRPPIENTQTVSASLSLLQSGETSQALQRSAAYCGAAILLRDEPIGRVVRGASRGANRSQH